MDRNFKLQRNHVGLLVVDVQQKLFPLVERPCETLEGMEKAIRGFQIMHLPIVFTEQYPQGLGSTISKLKALFGEEQKVLTKTTFSCLGHSELKEEILSLPVTQWVVIGIEAHVCILQTVKDLIAAGKEVVVLNDAITSRSIFDYSTAIAEMRDIGVRISSVETVLFELLGDSKVEEFKAISALVK